MNEHTPNRRVLAVRGPDRTKFMQGLVSNDVNRADTSLVYAAMLTPQGKYLADFFLHETGDALLVDVAESLADGLAQRLGLYKLRADVTIENCVTEVARGTGEPPAGALRDPRHAALGWRAYGADAGDDGTDWDAVRVAHVIPESGVELVPNETYILEAGFERLNGVDFKKGCYVGQEVTARMKHKTQLKKGLVQVEIEGEAPVGTPIAADGRPAGTLYTQSGGRAIAYLRFDRAKGEMRAGDTTLVWNG